MTNFQKHEAYKDSGVEWLGEIPEGWEVKRLRNVCDMLVSNVDKHTKPLEHPVRLCNYVDVYKNEFITSEIHFMKATATADEIRRFSIKIDDVIITKDSEDWLDIGVPALVKYEDEKLICGYHLAILRPKRTMTGRFLHRAILSQYIRTQFSVKANGVTRYGISHGAILGTFIVTPPLPEQTRIATFLDQKTAQIDQAIAQKERLIELLKERRQILIQKAVTRGLNQNVRMKDSGVEWIGEIPEHWEVKRIKHVSTQIVDGAHFTPTYVDEGIPFLRVTDLSNPMQESIDWGNVKYIPLNEHKELIKRAKPQKGDILLSKNGTIGLTKVVEWDEEFSFFVSLCLIKPLPTINPQYFCLFFNSPLVDRQITYGSSRTSVTNLHLEKIKELILILPPVKEQSDIVEDMNRITAKFDKGLKTTLSQIEKLKEYKATLINSAVTGKIKV